MSDLVTLCITSYNRLEKLSYCLDSFLMTNQFDNSRLQLVVIDNGSDDPRVIDKIKSLGKQFSDFKYHLNEKNDYPYCLRRAKNQAREIADGDFFIDCPDDHLFIVKSNWVEECVSFVKDRIDTISCVCHYAYPEYRFRKPNNAMTPSGKKFFVSTTKGYSDYHVMAKEVYENIGLYREDLAFTPNAESEYMERTQAAGLRRALMRHPVSIVNDHGYKLLSPISHKDYIDSTGITNTPISNEKLISLAAYMDKIE